MSLNFLTDRSGNFAIMAALATLPALAAAGLAVDYYSMTEHQKRLQNAVDAAVLAVTAAGPSISTSQANDIVQQYLASNFGADAKVKLKRDGTTVELYAEATSPMYVTGIFGTTERPIGALATATQQESNYEIGLVLDTTGSMAGAKMTALKDAATALVDDMSTSVKGSGKLRFALVPFSTFVNVGPQYGPQYNDYGLQTQAGAKWLDIYAQSPIPQSDADTKINRFALMKRMGIQWSGCVESRYADTKVTYDIDDTVPDSKNPETLFVPAFNPDEPDNPGLYPNSYLADGVAGIGTGTFEQRMQRYGAPAVAQKPTTLLGWIIYILSWKKVVPDTSVAKFYSNYPVAKGPNFACAAQPITPLTDNYAQIKKDISSLQPLGSTNILEGAAWGWRVLSSREPFSEGAAEGTPGTRKVMVLLTDGTNSFGNLPNALGSSYTSFGYLVDGRIGSPTLTEAGTTTAMDDKTLAACTNAKNDGVEIYTVLLEENNKATSALLEKCASGSDHFFNVPDHAKLKAVFTNIVNKVGKVRLAS